MRMVRAGPARIGKLPRLAAQRFTEPHEETPLTSVMTSEVARFRELLEAARRIVFFTGAGISTESGIPDFRSPGGIWTRFRPIDFGEFMASEEARREAWRRKFETDKTLRAAKPNAGHAAVARLVQRGRHRASSPRTSTACTRHQECLTSKWSSCMGTPPTPGALPAGSAMRSSPCASSSSATERHQPAAAAATSRPRPSRSARRCRRRRWPAPRRRRTAATSSYPSARRWWSIPPPASPPLRSGAGAGLVILNREPTDFDDIADLVLHREIGPTLSQATGANA